MIRTDSCITQKLSIEGAFSRFAELNPSHGILLTVIIFTQPGIKRGLQCIYNCSTLFQTVYKKEQPLNSCKNSCFLKIAKMLLTLLSIDKFSVAFYFR